MKPALIIGSTCVDIIIHIDHLPKTEENLHPTSQTMALGGCAYNVAHMMRLFHAPHTFITPIGTGIYGDYVIHQLTALQIPLSVRVPNQENGCCYCLVESGGERTFLSVHGAEYTFQKSWMDSYPAEDYQFVYICGLEIEESTGMQLIEYLEEHPCLKVCYAPGPRGAILSSEKAQRMLSLHPLLHINEQEALALSGCSAFQNAAEVLYAQTRNTVIITLGAQGTYCKEQDGKTFFIPSVPAKHVVDTIGAGDAHIGTILALLTKGYSLRKAISCANLVSAAVVETSGATISAEQLPAALSQYLKA
ncbi:MAG: carbohydrate kinase family protein [Lachnospiraceae bacterium]|mgnify:CR=1 FL=1|nr:carbohydrate kinase family protein [Lachnospiraceae bacterium]